MRRRGWRVVAAALVPLALLLVLQYRWLVRLEHVSAVASRATLDNYLEAVVSAVEVHYRGIGERALNLAPALFTAEKLHKAAYYFRKKGADGAGRLFGSAIGTADPAPLLADDPIGRPITLAGATPAHAA